MATNILIVDDDPLCREVIATSLEGPGRQVVSASCGLEALGAIERVTPQIVVLDCALPGKSGIEVLRHLRGSARFKEVPVLLVSARSTERYQEAMLAEGAQGFFTKPLDLPRLAQAVSALARA